MEQATLFFESYLDALKDDVRAIGGAKAVGFALKPDLPAENARNWANDRLNENRRERFSDTEERWIMRQSREARGFSAALQFICDDTGFERPKELSPQDEQAALYRAFIDAVRSSEQIAQRIERLAGLGLKVAK